MLKFYASAYINERKKSFKIPNLVFNSDNEASEKPEAVVESFSKYFNSIYWYPEAIDAWYGMAAHI